jgi:aryl sulfotransferase
VVKPPADIRDYYHEFLDRGPYDFHPFWSHVQSWWDIRHLPNVLFVHHANLKADMAGEIRRVAEFLGIAVDSGIWPKVIEHSGFDWMKKNADKMIYITADIFDGGPSEFFSKGTNGRWKDLLSADEIAKCDEVAAKNLTPDCAHWLKTGEMPN